MSLTRRFMNLARANLNALLDRVADTDTGNLETLSDEELEAELLRRKARREREEEDRQTRAQAERAARARAAASGTGTSGSSSTTSGGGGTGSGTGSGGRARATDPRRLAQYYAQLEVPFGADLAEVKASYRRLMRKYHPDRYPNDPPKAAMATELTQKLAQAYREIEAALRDKRQPGKRM